MNFREFRLSEGLRVPTFAKKMGIPVTTAYRLDAGGKPSNKTAIKLILRIFETAPVQEKLNIIESQIRNSIQRNALSLLPNWNKIKELLLKKQARELSGLKLAA